MTKWLQSLIYFSLLALAVIAVAAITLLLGRGLVPRTPDLSPTPDATDTASLEVADKKASESSVNYAPTASAAPVTILTVGDVMLGRSVNTIGHKRRDFGWSLRDVDDHLADFDYVIANLETPITYECPLTDEGMIFCAHASSSAALADSQIDLVTLANNHIYNYGREGYRQTRSLLRSAGQDFVGSDELFTFVLGNVKFGVIAHDDVSFPLDTQKWAAYVASSSAQVDHLLVALHFGEEYRYQPTARQRALAHASIDAGASLVIGNHSHWLGTVEKYGDGAIIYSHGNFVFDQEWSLETKSGLAAAWTFSGAKLQKVAIYPVFITNYGLAHWAEGSADGKRILNTFLEESGNGTLVDDHVEIILQADAQNNPD